MRKQEEVEERLRRTREDYRHLPAYFNDPQRHASKDAGVIACLRALRFINKSANAVAYGLNRKVTSERNGLILKSCYCGDTHLGGHFDIRLMNHFAQEVKRKRKIGVDPQTTLSRTRFDELCQELFRSTLEPVERSPAMRRWTSRPYARLCTSVGSRIPRIVKPVSHLNGKKPNKSIKLDETVACRAAVPAAILSGDTAEKTQGLLLLDIAPLSVSIKTADGVMTALIKRDTMALTKKSSPPMPTTNLVCLSKSTKASVRARRTATFSSSLGLPDPSRAVCISLLQRKVREPPHGSQRRMGSSHTCATCALRHSLNDEKLKATFESFGKIKLEPDIESQEGGKEAYMVKQKEIEGEPDYAEVYASAVLHKWKGRDLNDETELWVAVTVFLNKWHSNAYFTTSRHLTSQLVSLRSGTTELTKSFDWKLLDSFLQHDVQEFNRVLQDRLESKMKGTKADGTITKLFVGKMKSLDYESARTEEFNETLDGNNKYQAEGYGVQDAKKGIVFQSFPPVLHLQLKRFEYDIQRDAMVKINDRHDFPFEIDLSEFLDESSDKSQSWLYKLHCHSGDLHGGHYFALIKPDRRTWWLKFDDDRVTPLTDREVLEENHGGEVMNGVTQPAQRNQVRAMKRFTNAYMLVYVRDTAIDEVLAPFTEEDTPPHLSKLISSVYWLLSANMVLCTERRLDEERLQIEARKRERDEQHLFLTAKLITDDTFQHHQGFDLTSFDEKNWPPSELLTFRVLRQETYSVFKGRVASHFNYQDSQFRLWVLVNRQNKTVRLDTHIPENEATLTMDMIRNNMAARQSDLRLYVDVITDPSKPDLAPGSIMIFLKHSDTSRQSLLGVGKTYVLRDSKVGNLAHFINERMRWPTGTPLQLFEEIKPGMIELMKPKMTFAQSGVQDGDVICFQVEMSEKETHDLDAQGLFSNPIQFYDFLQNRVLILFRPKNEVPDENLYPEFELTLSKKMNYDHMAAKVADYLKHDILNSASQQLTPPTVNPKPSLNNPSTKVSRKSSTIILYERLDVSIVELETKRSLQIIWTGVHNEEESSHPFLLPKTSMVHELADHLAKKVTLTPGGTGKIRVFEVLKDGKNQKEFTSSKMIGNIPDPVELYAEEVPTEELEADNADKIISVFHFSKDVSRTHGVPFKFVVKPGDQICIFLEVRRHLFCALAEPAYVKRWDYSMSMLMHTSTGSGKIVRAIESTHMSISRRLSPSKLPGSVGFKASAMLLQLLFDPHLPIAQAAHLQSAKRVRVMGREGLISVRGLKRAAAVSSWSDPHDRLQLLYLSRRGQLYRSIPSTHWINLGSGSGIIMEL
ncbi:hypothetical protein BD410DRAFT_806893 [Rickenella mellea]|uniref:ubiquitinyl hydrolase 1 n=1 Tax=Rickenella mellea TaxID=50990 RepID=A0A4Y7PSM0_9AGAM|nr:hypothetical protein BD410DRAFT_806893 [Rickenella mellea]